ncbi:phage major capsid protein [Streptomyces sp. NPDC018019]|uniref:phage major capsid protein n=1 Tax=Streptomyces sp. NPDC018019 TaxID=3365030 RepID=UPI003789EAEF
MPDTDPIDGAPVRLDVPVCRALSQHVAVRSDSSTGGMPTMTGHFSVFGNWYEINSHFEGQFLERITPGAFRKTLSDDASRKNPGERIKVLLEHGHDPQVGDKPLGVPVRLAEDDLGPAYEVPLLDTSYCRDLVPALEAGAYGSSFRFQVMQDEWNDKPERSDGNPGALPERTIKEVRVLEFGPTVFPANASATAGLRSTTDDYYDKLRSRQPERYEEALRRVRSQRAGSPFSPAGDVVYADSAGKKFPLGTADQVKAAWAAVNDPKKGADYSPEGIAAMKSKIQAAAKKMNITLDGKAAPPAKGDAPKKKGTPPPFGGAAPEKKSEEPRKHSAGQPPSNSQRSDDDVPELEFQMTVEERAARQEEIRSRLAELDAEYNGAVLPEDRQAEWDAISAEFDDHRVAIEAATRRSARIRALAGEPGHTEGGADLTVPHQIRTRSDVYDVSALRKQARSMDDLGRLLKDNALRAVDENRYPSAEDQQTAQAQVERLIRNVDDREGTLSRRILTTGHERYDRAFGKAVLSASTDTLTNEERAALAMGADATGAFAVPFQLDPTVIMTGAGVVNPIRSLARVVQVTGKTWQGITSAGIAVTREAEATEAVDGSPTIAQPSVTPTRVQGFVPFSFEVDQDWQQMRGELGMMFEEAKDTEESASFILGSGLTVNPQGVVTGVASGQQIETAAVTSFTVPDLYSLADALPPRHTGNASWLANKATYNKIRQFDTAGGANLWERLGAGTPSQLLGYPAYEASAMATALTAGIKILLLGDFKKFLIVDKVGMNVELIPHLFGGTANYPTGQRGMYAVWRNSSKVLDSGAFRLLKVKT